MLGILLHPDNRELPMPLILTGPADSEAYFRQIDEFVGATLGPEAQRRYSIIIDDPERVAREILIGIDEIWDFRRHHGDAYFFNWRLEIDHDFQKPFTATHEVMRALELTDDLPVHVLAVNLRRAFSGIVSGNVRDDTMAAIEEHGPFEIHGSKRMMQLMDKLLTDFVAHGRMKLAIESYAPCYRIVR